MDFCKFFKTLLALTLISIISFPAEALTDHIDGIEYLIRKIDEPSVDIKITNKYDLYELYFENRSDNAFTIPGYSINLGLDYATLQEIQSQNKNKSSKKFAILGLAASASSLALGGIAGSAAKTAIRSSGFFRQKGLSLDENASFLSSNKTFVLYPRESLSIFFFVNKRSGEIPTFLKFICKNEDSNINYVLVNKNLQKFMLDVSAKVANQEQNTAGEQVIASPDLEQYK